MANNLEAWKTVGYLTNHRMPHITNAVFQTDDETEILFGT